MIATIGDPRHCLSLYWHALVLCMLMTRAATAEPAFTIRMSDELVLALLNVSQNTAASFHGLPGTEGEIPQLSVFSNRQVLASKFAEAAVKGRPFTVPADLRADTVSILCGDNNHPALFGCVQLRLRVLGKMIRPLAYRALNEKRVTGAGVKWRARVVAGIYSAKDLDKGFTIEYETTNNSSLTRIVSGAEASTELLLTLSASGQ